MAPKNQASPKRFRLRNRKRDIERDLTEERILSRIQRGKYTGEEEIAEEPAGEWRKIGSVPIFYDALVKQLLEGAYQPPTIEEKKEEAPKEGGADLEEKATRQHHPAAAFPPTEVKEENVADKTAQQDEVLKTRQIDADLGQPAGDIDPQVIDDLFSDGTSPGLPIKGNALPQAVPKDPEWYRHPAQVSAASGASSTPDEITTTRKLQLVSSLQSPGVMDTRPPQEQKNSQRKKVYLIAILLLGAMLFYFGDQEPVKVAPEADLKVKPEIVTDEKLRVEKIENRIVEGDILHSLDSPLAYRRAFELYLEALSYDDSRSETLTRVATSAGRLLVYDKNEKGMVQLARDAIHKGRLTDPQSSHFYRAEALLSLAAGDLDQARSHINNAVETDEQSTQNALLLGEIAYALRDLETANRALQIATEDSETKARAFHFLGKIALDLGDLDKAHQMSLKVLEANPFHIGAGVQIAEVAEKKKDLPKANKLYKSMGRFALLAEKPLAKNTFLKIAELEASNPEVRKEFITYAYYIDPQDEEIKGVLESLKVDFGKIEAAALKFLNTKEFFISHAYGFMYQARYVDAINYLQTANLLDGNDGVVLMSLGDAIEKKAQKYGDFRRVTTFYERAINKDRTLMLAYVKLGLLETEQYNLERAFTLLKQAESLAPDRVEPYVALGKYYYKGKDYQKSVEYFVKAQSLDKENSEIYYYAGKLLLHSKSEVVDQAMLNFEKAIKLDPKNYPALIEWLKLKVLTYQKSFAVKFVKNMIESDPNNAHLYWALGEVYSANKEFRRATDFYKKSLDLDNTLSQVRMALGSALEAIGRMEQAVPEFELASRLDRRNVEGYFKAAELRIESKEIDEAERILKELLDRSPNYPGAHRYLARIHALREKPKLAIESMSREVSNNPDNITFRIELAEMHMRYDQYKEAVEHLTKVTNFKEEVNTRAFTYAKVKAFIRLSMCYRKLERYEGALGVIQQAVALDGELPEVQRELGYVYYFLQRNQEAARAFQKYLSQSPTAADAREIRKMVDGIVMAE